MSGLHRTTLRGVTKCPHCGTYNGNKSRRCKNSKCGKVKTRLRDGPSCDEEALFGSFLSDLDVCQANLAASEELTGLSPQPQLHANKLGMGGTHPPVVNRSDPDLSEASLGFAEWLSSVIERINQTMHFQFTGKPEPLVFHIPQLFFDQLHKRMCSGEKLRLPDKVCSFTRHHSAPLGMFKMYVWHLHSPAVVARLFCTRQMKLKMVKWYKQNGDGSYSEAEQSSEARANISLEEGHSDHFPYVKITPGTLSTAMVVGRNILQDGCRRSSPFVVEWIPDILPLSGVGELRIIFQYEHKSR